MLEPLRAIPGPEFLLYYAAAMAIVFILVRVWAYDDGSMSHIPPQLTRVDPYAVAVMRGGAQEALNVAVYDLERQGAISLSGQGEEVQISPSGKPMDSAHPAAMEVYRCLSGQKPARELFMDKALLGNVERGLETTYADLRRRYVLRDEEHHLTAWKAFGVGMALLWSAGGAKLYLGVTHSKPVGFLVFMLLAVPFLLGWAARPAHKLTAMGRKHLAELQSHFGWVKDAARARRGVDSANMAFAVALFGGGVFAEGIMYDLYNKAAVPPSSHGSSSNGCGGSSGCGGGGGCGGCGGCG